MGNILELSGSVPATNGRLGGLYLPSGYGMDSGRGTVLYCGKSVMSSGDVLVLADGGFKITGGGINGSRRWASPSTSIVETFLYLAAFLSMLAIKK